MIEADLQPTVSIIINNYNYDRFLAEAIDSALNQTYPHVEVVVVDDASVDKSRKTIDGYKDKIIKIFRQQNGKQGAALNDGFAASTGKIIIFLDSDDYLFPQAVERIVEVWEPEISKVHYRLQAVDSEGNSLGYSYPQGDKPLSKGNISEELLEHGGYAGTSMSGNAINRNTLQKLFPIPQEHNLTADNYLSTLVPFHGRVIAVEEALAAYRIHDDNQWALTTLGGDRFRRFIKHDLVTQNLIVDKAEELNYTLPNDFKLRLPDKFWVRLISLRLEPQLHPIDSDNRLSLITSGIYSIWKFSNYSWIKQIALSVWIIIIGLFPLEVMKTTIVWFYKPKLRPKWMRLLLTS